jgi:hypothetical protein
LTANIGIKPAGQALPVLKDSMLERVFSDFGFSLMKGYGVLASWSLKAGAIRNTYLVL